MKKTIFYIIKIINACRIILGRYIFVGQYTTNRNYGDALGIWIPILLNVNKGKILPARCIFKWQYKRGINLQMVGSTLGDVDTNSIVCGSGAISETQLPKTTPLKVLSVRGPLTREILLKQGIDCPAIYGDPALLLPLFYKPINVIKKYKLGIIPHYVDNELPIIDNLAKQDGVRIINILLPRNKGRKLSIEKFWKQWIDVLCSCEVICSSSLHGLIIADAYGIPSVRVKFSENINGGDFKFKDYYNSILTPPLLLNFINNTDLTIDDIISSATIKDTSAIDIERYARYLCEEIEKVVHNSNI